MTKPLKQWCLCAALTAASPCGQAIPTDAKPWVVCVPNAAIPPFITANPDAPGRIELLIAAAAAEAQIPLNISYAPLPRCLALTERGQADATISAPNARSDQIAVFPTVNGHGDEALRLAHVKAVFLARKVDAVSWSGKSLLGGIPADSPRVGVRRQLNAVIVALRSMDMQVDERALTLKQVLAMLKLRRIDVAAAIDEEWVQERSLGDAEGIERVKGPAFVELNYFLAISHQRWAVAPERSRAWWLAISRLRRKHQVP